MAEIGDVHRFPAAAQLCSWAGLTPSHRESDATERRGRGIGKVAAARKLLTLVCYSLRDGEIRCLAKTG